MSTLRGGKVSLAELIRLAVDARTGELRVSMPATIESFDAATQLASVRPCLGDTVIEEDGTELAAALPVIVDVPVQFPGGGGFAITFPVEKGDPCHLVFADRSLDKWIDSGGAVDPVAMHAHHLTDAVALLGVRSKPGAIGDFQTGAASFGKGACAFEATASELHLGRNASEAVVKGTTYRSAEDTLIGAVNSAMTAIASAFTALSVVPPIGTPSVPNPACAAAATAATAFAAAKAAFDAAATTYLSNRAKTE